MGGRGGGTPPGPEDEDSYALVLASAYSEDCWCWCPSWYFESVSDAAPVPALDASTGSEMLEYWELACAALSSASRWISRMT